MIWGVNSINCAEAEAVKFLSTSDCSDKICSYCQRGSSYVCVCLTSSVLCFQLHPQQISVRRSRASDREDEVAHQCAAEEEQPEEGPQLSERPLTPNTLWSF